MSCSRSDLLTGGDKRLHQGYRDLACDADCCLGKRAAAYHDPLCLGLRGRPTSPDQRTIQRGRISHQRLGVTGREKTAQISAAMGLHQSVNGRGELGRCCHDGKRRTVLPRRPRSRSSYADNGTVQPLCQGDSAGIPESCHDNRRGWWQVGISDGPGGLLQCRGIGNHLRRGDICPTPHIRQVLHDDAQHRRSRLLRTVRIDQQNRFHQMRYPA